MQKLFSIGALALTGLSAFTQTNKRPNIIFILSDDHATQAISAYQHRVSKIAPTPNIDRIANNGAIFWNNYCANSISGPSRASILTGKHSHKNGFLANWNKEFDGSQQTLPKILQENGYETALIGKWHLISKPTGFDHWMILNNQGEYNNPDFITKKDTVQYFGYVTDLITTFTKQWLQTRDSSQPFFLMTNHKAPHRNWVPAERHYNLYENDVFPLPETYFDDYSGRYAAKHQEMNIYRDMYEGHDLKMTTGVDSDSLLFDPWSHVFLGKMSQSERVRFFDAYRKRNNDFHRKELTEKELAEWKFQRYLQDYLATIKSVDESVGQILDYLEKTGLDENTIILYTSDQGFYLGEHGWFDKRFMYEESFQMPLVIQYKNNIKPGSEINALTQNIDFVPTLLEICQIPIPSDIHGVSYSKLFNLEKTPDDWRKSLYYHYYEFPGFHSVRAHCGVKTERYKLIHFYKENNWELYDLENDKNEINNIYGKAGTSKITKELKSELKRLQLQYEVPKEFIQ